MMQPTVLTGDAAGAFLAEVKAANGTANGNGADVWDLPVPLDYEPRPAFPTEAMPDSLAPYVKAVAEACQVPTDLPALSALSLLASSVHKHIDLDTGRGRVFPLNLWALTVYPSGGGKSRVMAEVQAPLVQYEQELQDRVARVNEERARDRSEIDDRIHALERQKARGEDEESELRSLRGRKKDTEELALPELFTSEATPEALEQKLVENNGRLAIWNAEGGDFFEILGGRYSNGKGNLGIVLKGYSQESTRIGRILRGTCWIDRPTLSMNLAVQPIVFDEVARRADFEKRGLIARFIFAYPVSMLGHRNMEDPAPVPPSLRGQFQRMIHSLLAIQVSQDPKGRPVAHNIELSFDGRQRFLRFASWAESELRPDRIFCDVQEFGARLMEHMAKVAGLLHCSLHPDEPWQATVSGDTVERAIAIVRWSAEHVRLAFGANAGDDRTSRARYVLERLKSRDEWKTGFKLRDLYHLVKKKRWYPDQAHLENDLDFLCEMGHLKEARGGSKVGRPARLFLVNPQVFFENAPTIPTQFENIDGKGLSSVGNLCPQRPTIPTQLPPIDPPGGNFVGFVGPCGQDLPTLETSMAKASSNCVGNVGLFSKNGSTHEGESGSGQTHKDPILSKMAPEIDESHQKTGLGEGGDSPAPFADETDEAIAQIGGLF